MRNSILSLEHSKPQLKAMFEVNSEHSKPILEIDIIVKTVIDINKIDIILRPIFKTDIIKTYSQSEFHVLSV